MVAKAALINPSMRVELKTAHFAINFVAIFNQLYCLLLGVFKGFFFEIFSRCFDNAFRIVG